MTPIPRAVKKPYRWPTILGGGLLLALALNLLVPPGGLPANAGQLVGQTPAHLVYTNVTKVTCASSSTALAAAVTGQPREVVIKVPAGATAGIHVGVAAAATTNMLLLEPGESLVVSGLQAVNCLRAGGSDVVTYLMTSTAGGYTP